MVADSFQIPSHLSSVLGGVLVRLTSYSKLLPTIRRGTKLLPLEVKVQARPMAKTDLFNSRPYVVYSDHNILNIISVVVMGVHHGTNGGMWVFFGP